MKKKHRFYLCEHCGNLVGMIHDAGVPIICCSEPMKELVANTSDAAQEKHVPVVEVEGKHVKVKVGDVAHPATEDHHISWVYLQTKKGGQRKALDYDKAPETQFCLTQDDEPVNVFAYCNLHGLWKKEL